MGNAARDDFSEADGTLLDGKATDTGETWDDRNGTWEVRSGRAHLLTTQTNVEHTRVGLSSEPRRVSAKVYTLHASSYYVGLAFKYEVGVNAFYYVRIRSGSLELYLYTGGGASGHTLRASWTGAVADGDTVEVRTDIGAGPCDMEVRLNGVSVIAWTENVPVGWGDAYAGLVASDTPGQFDDFEADVYIPLATTARPRLRGGQVIYGELRGGQRWN